MQVNGYILWLFVVSRMAMTIVSCSVKPRLSEISLLALVTATCFVPTKRPYNLLPHDLFQNESKREAFHMKMSSACSFIFTQIKVIFIGMVLHLVSL